MLQTKRLILRQWNVADIAAFADLNSDSQVMQYFPDLWDESRTRDFVEIMQGLIAQRGWGFWAAELKEGSQFIGMVGLNVVPFEIPDSQTDDRHMEIGWRLAQPFWGQGLATEAAQASLDYAFQTLKERSVFAFTPVANQRSRRVMEKLNMSDLERNFSHPLVPDDSPLAEHVLYSIERGDYIKTRDWQ